MSEEQVVAKDAAAPEILVPKNVGEIPDVRELFDDVVGCMVNVWTNDPNRGVQGMVIDFDDRVLEIKAVDGKHLFIAWAGGPIAQKI